MTRRIVFWALFVATVLLARVVLDHVKIGSAVPRMTLTAGELLA